MLTGVLPFNASDPMEWVHCHVAMSGYMENVVASHGVLKEGVHFLQKPFRMNDLARRVRHAREEI